jgi:hypothetical protein
MTEVKATWPSPAATVTDPNRRIGRTSSLRPTTNSSNEVPTDARSSISEVGWTTPSAAGPTAICSNAPMADPPARPVSRPKGSSGRSS